MYLFLNTAAQEDAALYLVSPEEVMVQRHQLVKGDAERVHVLKEIDQLLQTHDLKSQDIKGIVVIQGPGHFSFLRTGIVIANTFGYVLKIPVAGMTLDEFGSDEEFIAKGITKLKEAKVGEPVMPEYGREPNISIAKK